MFIGKDKLSKTETSYCFVPYFYDILKGNIVYGKSCIRIKSSRF
jgi:hypothetical protein